MSELKTFLCPEAAFSHPLDVVKDPDLGTGEKRAVLARWLARTCAFEAALGLKWLPQPRGEMPHFDDIMDALRALEGVGRPAAAGPTYSARKPHRAAGTVH